MKKVLVIITTDFVPFGGLTTVMMNYYRKINKDNIKMDFASTNSDIDDKLITELKNNNSAYYCLGNRKKKLISYLVNLYKLLKTNSYDIIHVNSNSATATFELSIARFAGVKKRIVHNHTSRCDYKRLHKLLFPIFKHMYTDAIACSDKAGQWIFENNSYEVLNNGIDTEKYKFDDLKRKNIRSIYKIEDECILIGHVGKIYEPKNHPFLIDVFKIIHDEFSNTKLMLVGDGEMRNQIEKQIHDLKLDNNVILVGMQNEVVDFLCAMDLFVFPSIWEGLPLSVVEAQATGLQCIISKNIDDTVCITDSVKMLPIDSKKVWYEEYKKYKKNDRKVISNRNIEMIKKAGFDSGLNVFKLEDLYLR